MAWCINKRRHAARRIGPFLEPAAGLDEAPDELVGLLQSQLGQVELLRRVALEQLVVGVVRDRAHRCRAAVLRIVEDLLFLLAEALGVGRQRPDDLGQRRRPGGLVLHHHVDDRLVILGLVIAADGFLIDQALQTVVVQLHPRGRIKNGGVPNRPDVLDGIDAGIR